MNNHSKYNPPPLKVQSVRLVKKDPLSAVHEISRKFTRLH